MKSRPIKYRFISLFFTICFGLSFASLAKADQGNEITDSNRLEIFPSISFLGADSLRASLLGGLTANWLVNESFWLGADFYAGSASTDHPASLNLQTKKRMLALDLAAYWNLPIYLKQSTTRKWADIYGSIGGGHIWIGPQKSAAGFIGGGLIIHTYWHHLAVHFDLKNYFYSLENSTGNDFNSDMSLSMGPSFIF